MQQIVLNRHSRSLSSSLRYGRVTAWAAAVLVVAAASASGNASRTSYILDTAAAASIRGSELPAPIPDYYCATTARASWCEIAKGAQSCQGCGSYCEKCLYSYNGTIKRCAELEEALCQPTGQPQHDCGELRYGTCDGDTCESTSGDWVDCIAPTPVSPSADCGTIQAFGCL